MDRGWPHNFERKIAVRSKTHRRKAALLKQNNKEEKEILPFVTQYKPLVSLIKEALMKKCNLIQKQPLPCQLNPRRMYTQNHTHPPTPPPLWYKRMVDGTPPQICYFDMLRYFEAILPSLKSL